MRAGKGIRFVFAQPKQLCQRKRAGDLRQAGGFVKCLVVQHTAQSLGLIFRAAVQPHQKGAKRLARTVRERERFALCVMLTAAGIQPGAWDSASASPARAAALYCAASASTRSPCVRRAYSCTLHARSSSEGEKRQAFTAVVPTSSTAMQRPAASCACICVPPISYAFPSLPNTRI